MPITTRDQLAEYCLRRLGAPVIEINVDDEQISERIDDGIQFWQEYHFDGVQRMYLKTQILASSIALSSGVVNFAPGETVTGLTSAATAIVYALNGTTGLFLSHVTGTFVTGETVKGSISLATGPAVGPATIGNWDQQYLTTTNAITGVIKVFPTSSGGTSGNVNNIFDVVYQFRLHDMYDMLSTDLIYYEQMKQHLSLLDMILPGMRSFQFNRKQNRVYIETNWYETFKPGDWVLIECYAIVDPADYPKVYDDMFLKRYITALIKRQWGTNMGKFEGIQLPGGVTLNGGKMYLQAQEEIEKIEAEMQSRYELPPMMMIG